MKLREDVTVLGDATAGWLLWRVGGQLHMTVVVKATFGFVQGETMARRKALPVHREDVLLSSGVGVIAPSDLVPYLGKTDVIVCGRPQDGDKIVRVVLRSDAGTLLDEAAPLAQLGAISAQDPRRRARLSAGVQAALAADVPDIPVDVDWEYFQAAPNRQQVELLRGDEWLLLRDLIGEGLTRSRLPNATAAIWVWPRGGKLDDGYPVTTVADRLLVDGAAETVTITWRGAIPLESEAVISELAVAAAVNQVGAEVSWDDAAKPSAAGAAQTFGLTAAGQLSVAVAATEPPPMANVTVEVLGVGAAKPAATVCLDDEEADADESELELTIPIARQVGGAGAGAGVGAGVTVELEEADGELEGTIGIAQIVAPEAVTPFPLPSPGARPALAPIAIPGAPWAVNRTLPVGMPAVVEKSDPMDDTVGIAAVLSKPATPFSGQAAPPARAAEDDPDLRGATSELTAAEAAKVWADTGLPFGEQPRPGPPASEPVSPWAGGPPPKRRAPALSLNAQIKAELGLDLPGAEATPPPPVPDAAPPPARPAAPTASVPDVPERVGPPPHGQTPAEEALPTVDSESAPAPPEGASHGEQFLAALAWLDENTKG